MEKLKWYFDEYLQCYRGMIGNYSEFSLNHRELKWTPGNILITDKIDSLDLAKKEVIKWAKENLDRVIK